MDNLDTQKIERFGFDPNAGLKRIGTVRTPRITRHGTGEFENWEIYFDERTKEIEVCFAGCNGTYFRGTENADGTTNLHPELDAVFGQLRKSSTQ